MKNDETYFTRSSSGLVRELSWWDVLFMVIATPAASGILYYSVSTSSSYPGGSVPLAFVIGMLLFLPIAALIAIISATIPRSGSLYVGISRLIDPSVAYLGAYLFFIGYSLTIGVLGYIIVGISGGILVAGGLAGNMQGLVSFGEALQTTGWQIIGGIVWVLLFWFITFRGIKAFKRIMKIVFFIPFIATLVSIIYFLFTSSGEVSQLFNNAWGEGAFEQIKIGRAHV